MDRREFLKLAASGLVAVHVLGPNILESEIGLTLPKKDISIPPSSLGRICFPHVIDEWREMPQFSLDYDRGAIRSWDGKLISEDPNIEFTFTWNSYEPSDDEQLQSWIREEGPVSFIADIHQETQRTCISGCGYVKDITNRILLCPIKWQTEMILIWFERSTIAKPLIYVEPLHI